MSSSAQKLEKSKARIGLRIKEKVGKKAKNRSGEVVAMTERFEVLKSKMKLLVASLHAQHASMVELNKTRQEVAKNVGSIAEKSPIYEYAGQLPGSETPKGAVTSYASVHQSMANRNKMYIDRYKQFVVDYAIEWEKVVVTRISSDLKTSEKLRLDLDHYQTKVENLRKSVNSTMAKGKLVDPKTSEKLKRNEEKLSKSRGEYEDYATQLCILIEEITERAWKDLHPLLIKMAQFDATLASDEAKLFSDLNGVVNNLKNVAQQHGLKPQARLKELSQMSASQIDTKGADSALRLTDGLASPVGSTTGLPGFASPMDGPERVGGGGVLSPGSVASHGSGAISPSNSLGNPDPFSRASSFASTGSFHSQTPGDMMAVAAASAPPPTLDMVADATGSMTLGNSPRNYSSGSLPPLPHGGSGGAASRSGSYVSDAGSVPMAPPPMAAPPPPPPPAGLSMYSAPSSDMVPSVPQPHSYGNYSSASPVPAPLSAPLPPMGAYNPSGSMTGSMTGGMTGGAPPQSTDPFAGGAMGGGNPFDN